MNEQVEQKANELLLNLIDKAQQGMEFAEAQIPDVVEQLLMWHFCASALAFCLWVFFAASSVFLFRHSFTLSKRARSAYEKGDAWTRWHPDSRQTSHAYDFYTGGIITFLSAFSFAVSIIGALSSLTWLKIWIAPKLYLLEYAASLAK